VCTRTRSQARAAMQLCAVGFLLSCAALGAQPQTVSGVVSNGTTGKPAAGDDVVLFSLIHGGKELAKGKTDSRGHFRLTAADEGPELVSVVHRGVGYFNPTIAGAKSVTITVYDSATKVSSITTALDALRMEANTRTLRVVELITVRNESKPPRTQLKADYDLALPAGAQLQSIAANIDGMPPQKIVPTVLSQYRYRINFAFRPGRTQLLVIYDLPYGGSTTLTLKPTHAIRQLVVAVPPTMAFVSPGAPRFRSVKLKSGANVEIAENIPSDSGVDLTVSGTGSFTKTPAEQGTGRPLRDVRDVRRLFPKPGWNLEYLLSFAVAALACGALVIMIRRRVADRAGVANGQAPAATRRPGTSGSVERLKTDFLELELRRQSGSISEDEYQASRVNLEDQLKNTLVTK
jgi:hypothetical protein